MRDCPPPNPNPSKPVHNLPAGSCDAHCHVFGPAEKFPMSAQRAYTPPDAPKETLFAIQDFLGFDRRVIVQASCHGTDNRALIDALSARPDTSRGVASLAENITDEELEQMHDAGARAARFNFMTRIIAPPPVSTIDKMIARIKRFDWHVVLHFDPDQILELTPWIENAECEIMIDHAGRLHASDHDGPFFEAFLRLMEKGNIWTKISSVERGSDTGMPYEDMLDMLRQIVAVAPDRTLWGTDWPHPVLGAEKAMPDDGQLVDYLWRVLPDKATRRKVLVDNPAALYGF